MTAADSQNSSLHELLGYSCPHSLGTKLAGRFQEAEQTAESVQVCTGSSKQRLQTKVKHLTLDLEKARNSAIQEHIYHKPEQQDLVVEAPGASYGLIPYFSIL